MMYIDTDTGLTAGWHVGEPVANVRVWQANVVCIQADGDELEYIRRNFMGIPWSNGRVVTWYGEMANFIARNIWLLESRSRQTHDNNNDSV